MKVCCIDPQSVNASASDLQKASYSEILTCAASDQYRIFSLTHDLEECDFIIAPMQYGCYGSFIEDLTRSSIYSRYKNKLYAYCTDDHAYAFIPGVYPATTATWVEHGWATGGHYLSNHIHKHKFDLAEIQRPRKWAFSFVGSTRTHPVRQKLLEIRHSEAFLFDSNPPTDATYWWNRKNADSLMKQFREVLLNSKFVLCPRGIAPSSIRVFEAMEAGCVPVVISDDVVLPKGPKWEQFSIRIAERQVNTIADVLQQYDSKFDEMSQSARQAWEDYFSPQSSFHSLATWTAEIHAKLRDSREKLEKKSKLESFFRSDLNKHRLRKLLKK